MCIVSPFFEKHLIHLFGNKMVSLNGKLTGLTSVGEITINKTIQERN